MQVLQLAESPYFGGINAHIRSVTRAFQGDGDWVIRVATLPGMRADRWLVDAISQVNVAEIQASPRTLREYVEREQIDLVHTHNYRATLLCALARLSVPVVNTCHGMVTEPSLKLRAYQYAEIKAMRRLTGTAAVSGFVRDWLVSKGLPEVAIRIIRNGCEPEPEEKPIDRAALGIPDDAIVYLYAGRLAEGKGVVEFIQALRGISRAFALLVGDGPQRAACEAAAKEVGVKARFVGVQMAVGPYYQLADVVVLASRMEALPMTLVEASAYGKPAVATRVGGIPEVVVDGETGLLIDGPEQLASALSQCGDLALRSRLGDAAHQRWREQFSLRQMRNALSGFYAKAIGAR